MGIRFQSIPHFSLMVAPGLLVPFHSPSNREKDEAIYYLRINNPISLFTDISNIRKFQYSINSLGKRRFGCGVYYLRIKNLPL